MTWAQFEEKEYEQAASIELADSDAGRGRVFSAGQVLEKIVGYDAAASPSGDHVIWRLLEVPRPRGIQLVPTLWTPAQRPDADRLPDSVISLILQYKRPEFLRGHQAKQWNLWACPYYRFTCENQQHRVLRRLERELGVDAVVRYAAPAFVGRGELEAAHIARRVLAKSGFVSPMSLGRHRVWTYDVPGVNGKGNPNGREQRFASFDQLMNDATRVAESGASLVPARPLNQQLLSVGNVAIRRQPDLRGALAEWTDALGRADLELDGRQAELVLSLAAIVSLTSSIKATWQVIAVSAP